MRVAIQLGSAALFAAAIHAQVVGSGVGGTIQMYAGMPGGGITGAPYSADEINEHDQTLADGTHIHQKLTVTHVFRDSQGRTRIERQFTGNPLDPSPPVMVEITDPVAGYRYILEARNKTVHRSSVRGMATLPVTFSAQTGAVRSGVSATFLAAGINGAAPVPPPLPAVLPPGLTASPAGGSSVSWTKLPPGGAQRPGMPEMKNERLDPQTIEGLLVKGYRNTMTFPIDSEGNDRPIVRTTESWSSPDLKINVLTKTTDPRAGDSVMRLTNIHRGEPDSSLFQPPADYTVVDDSNRLPR